MFGRFLEDDKKNKEIKKWLTEKVVLSSQLGY